MAWRPTEFFLEGELDNTVPGKVTGWMRFAGLDSKVTFDLQGDFHRDIRGTLIKLRGEGKPDDPKAAAYMDRFALHQTGQAGDITAGREPRDYTDYPYIEWYGEENGRVVLELDPEQVQVIGTLIPDSEPISRTEQQQHMADFMAGMSSKLSVPVILAGPNPLVSDPAFTHWVVVKGQIIGEAHSVESKRNGICFAYVRLFAMPECAEYGSIEAAHLRAKQQACARKEAAS